MSQLSPAYAPPGYGPPPGYGLPPGYGPPPSYVPPPGYGAAPPFPPPPVRPLPPLAEWWERVMALLVDSAVSQGPQLVGLCVLLATLEERTLGFEGERLTLPWPSAWGLAAFVVGSLVSTGLNVWNRWIRQGRTGQSVGKQLMGLRVVGEASLAPQGVGATILRELCHVLDGYLYVGYLWPLWDARRRTFADMVMHTVVVQVPDRTP